MDTLTQAKAVIIQSVQEEAYAKEFESIRGHKEISKDSPLHSLNSVTDKNGLLRIGGRISQAKIESDEKNPIIIPHWSFANKTLL